MDTTLDTIDRTAINPALALLPGSMDSAGARVLLHAIGLQESRFEHRRQLVGSPPLPIGPAISFWQFELGTRESKGGVWGVFLHPASSALLRQLCVARGVQFAPKDIWRAIEHDDVLAAGLARLLLWTDPQRLPALGDADGAWLLYAKRCWRPGKPHPQTWPGFYQRALAHVRGAG